MALPAFWVTTLAKVLSGDQPCPLQPWLSGRMKFPKRDSGGLAVWKAKHTELLRTTTDRLVGEGWKVAVEQFFRVEGAHAIASGKADLIVQPKNHSIHRPRIIDCKTGEPKDSDAMQVIVEIVLIPIAWGKRLQFDGQVVYADDFTVDITHAEAEAVSPKLFALLKRLGTEARPEPQPSKSACMFCDVPASECAVRWQEKPGTKTELF